MPIIICNDLENDHVYIFKQKLFLILFELETRKKRIHQLQTTNYHASSNEITRKFPIIKKKKKKIIELSSKKNRENSFVPD